MLQQSNANPISLTPAAAAHIKTKLEGVPGAIAFRLSAEDAGCNSKKYVTDYVTDKQDGDIEIHAHDVTIIIDKADLLYLAGTEIDYVKDGINKVLKYNNPNVTSACGCGESFNVEEDGLD